MEAMTLTQEVLIDEVLTSVADQVNAGALGPNVTAWTGRIDDELAVAATRVARPPDKTALPPAMLDAFRQFRGASDANYFGLGDAVDAAVVELAGKSTQRRIYQAAAVESEYSIAEVRLLHETSRATPLSLRAEFEDVLCHQHFRTVRYLDPEKQHFYLKWAIESADVFGGRPAPAAVLAKKVRKDMGLEPPAPTFAELLGRAVSALERARDACEDARRHDKLNALLAELEKMA
jgi:hypothetical protein